MGEVQKIIEQCISDGIRVGVERAFREVEQPKKISIMYAVEQQISWLLDEREAFVWADLTDDEIACLWGAADSGNTKYVQEFGRRLEAKLKEKNT
jgi:hypothetical protein